MTARLRHFWLLVRGEDRRLRKVGGLLELLRPYRGRIAERGTHDELLESSELYREIAEKGAPDRRFLTRETAEREVAGL